ncbi:MAG: heme ABC exporter ATP-binding protein CcmA [Cypionkella sp.]|nr:heme ABC exporter ATP-binding protein CcmA [Cypionkella sp.]
MLTAHDISVARGGIMVLQGVTFVLNAGQALILRGPNGSGKTTLLRAIAGLQPIASGTLTGAEDTIAYGAHNDGVKPTLTVAENLAFWAQVYGSDLAHYAMTAMQLTPLQDRRAGNLSAGQKRRLGLARILVTARPIWVLDEPTVSLDAAAVALFAGAVRAHLAAGGAALIATHIDMGIQAAVLDVTPHRAQHSAPIIAGQFDEAFL